MRDLDDLFDHYADESYRYDDELQDAFKVLKKVKPSRELCQARHRQERIKTIRDALFGKIDPLQISVLSDTVIDQRGPLTPIDALGNTAMHYIFAPLRFAKKQENVDALTDWELIRVVFHNAGPVESHINLLGQTPLDGADADVLELYNLFLKGAL